MKKILFFTCISLSLGICGAEKGISNDSITGIKVWTDIETWVRADLPKNIGLIQEKIETLYPNNGDTARSYRCGMKRSQHFMVQAGAGMYTQMAQAVTRDVPDTTGMVRIRLSQDEMIGNEVFLAATLAVCKGLLAQDSDEKKEEK